jgi:threonine aldolase
MRESAKNSICGDNVWDTDETTVQLEKHVAELFGKPSGWFTFLFHFTGLFVSSGTQGNLISLMVHAKGFSAILGNKSHINVYEQGGISTIGGIFPRIVNNLPDGSMEIKDILDQIPDSNIHYCPVWILIKAKSVVFGNDP